MYQLLLLALPVKIGKPSGLIELFSYLFGKGTQNVTKRVKVLCTFYQLNLFKGTKK